MRFLFVLFLFGFQFFLFAQEVRFEHLTIEDGLSQNSAFDITRDQHGFLWVGTLDGLNRYDGKTFQTLKHRTGDSLSLSANNVWQLSCSKGGKIIVRYQTSDLDIVDPQDFRVEHFSNLAQIPLPALGNARGFCEDSKGNLFVSFTGSLVKYSPITKTHHQYFIPGGVHGEDQIMDVCTEYDTLIWVTTTKKVFTVNPETGFFTEIKFESRLQKKIQHHVITWLCKDPHNVIWLGDERLGLCYYDSKDKKLRAVSTSQRARRILKKGLSRIVFFDSKGNAWMGSDIGVFRLTIHYSRDGSPQIYDAVQYAHDPLNPASISNNNILSIYEDDESILWIGTTDGLNKVIPNNKKFITSHYDASDPHSLGDGSVWTMLEDRLGRLWVGTHTGLYRRENERSGFRKISAVRPVCLSEDSSGTLWIGTRNGLYYSRGTGNNLKLIFDSSAGNVFGGNFIYSLLPDDRRNIWWGTSIGLAKYNYGSRRIERFFSDSNFIQRNLETVMSMCKTNDGYLWIGTNGGGLIRFDTKNNSYKVYQGSASDKNAISNNVVSCIYQSHDNTLWVGTFAGGIDKVVQDGDSLHFIPYKESDGLKTDMIYGILEDKKHNLWLSTAKGLSKFSPREKTFRTYLRNDGTINNEFNQNAYHRGRSGKFYFGAHNGMMEFFPDSIQDSKFIPPIAITQFKIFDEDYSPLLRDSVIVLSYNQNFFSFELSSLSLVAPGNNCFAYMLKGLDKEWVQAGSKRFVRYTNIDPGEYVFHVKGSNNDGIWNEQGTSIKIIISPPWWATVWFKLFSAFGFISGIFTGSWYVSRRKLKKRIVELEHERALTDERQRVREKIARDLHDDVASTLNSISLYAETIQHRSNQRRNDLENAINKLSAMSSDAKQSMEEVVWSLSPSHDSLKNLVDRIGDLSVQWCHDHSLECHLAFCIIPPEIMIAEEVRKNIYLIFKEAINNIIKHSDASSVELLSWFEDDVFYLTIRDDGKGIERSGARTRTIGGHGLKNMNARAEKIGAVIHIDSMKNKGTSISVQVKMAQLRH